MRTTGFDPTSRFVRMIMEVRFGARLCGNRPEIRALADFGMGVVALES